MSGYRSVQLPESPDEYGIQVVAEADAGFSVVQNHAQTKCSPGGFRYRRGTVSAGIVSV